MATGMEAIANTIFIASHIGKFQSLAFSSKNPVTKINTPKTISTILVLARTLPSNGLLRNSKKTLKTMNNKKS